MPVAGGPFIQKTGILLNADAANAASYTPGSTVINNAFNPSIYNGTLNGTIAFNSLDSKGALVFPASNSYVDFGNIGNLATSWSFQIAVKPVASASYNHTILSYSSGSVSNAITFKLDYSSSNQSVVLSAYSVTGSAAIVHTVTGSVPSGSWSIINASYGNQVLGMYVNGRPTDYAVTTGSTVAYSTNNRLYLGGTFLVTSSYYTGSVGSLFVYNSDVPNTQLIQNYNAFATRFGLQTSLFFPSSVDPDAFRFLEIANITNQTQITAINNLVVGLKSNNLWNKMAAIYPFVGGTAFTHKWNLKNPADTDNAFRAQYVGSIVHSNDGVTSTGGYINTYFNSTFLAQSSSFHYSLYVYTATLSNNTGLVEGGSATVYRPNVFGTMQVSNYQTSTINPAQVNIPGFIVNTRTDASVATLYRYLTTGNFTDTNSSAFSSNTNNISILGGPTSQPYRDGILNFASLGSGLTAGESTTLNTIIRNFNIALSRNAI
jgi:hypothetical protein